MAGRHTITAHTSAQDQRVLTESSYSLSQVWSILVIPGDSVIKNLPANARDMGSVPGSGRSSGEESGNPFHYSCLGNPTDRGASKGLNHKVTKESNTT